jgi:hypothetical protein
MKLEELKKEGIRPIAQLNEEKNGKIGFRIQGSQEALKKYFDEVYDWTLYPHGASTRKEDDEEVSFYGEEEGYIFLSKDDPIIPELNKMALEFYVEKLREVNEKRADILAEIIKHFEVTIEDNANEEQALGINIYVEGLGLGMNPEVFDNPTLMTGQDDIEIDEDTPVEEVITTIKKVIIESQSK